MITVLFFFFKQKTAYEVLYVTGVQTCALPISLARTGDRDRARSAGVPAPARRRVHRRASRRMAPLIIAHRGHCIDVPEQTMAAFRRAIELGADMIEADVRRDRKSTRLNSSHVE